MLTHVVLFSLKPDAPEGAAERLVADAREKLTRIPGVKHLSAGRVLQTESLFDVGLAMQFDGRAELDAYRVHPIHKEYVAYLQEVVADRQAFDFD